MENIDFEKIHLARMETQAKFIQQCLGSCKTDSKNNLLQTVGLSKSRSYDKLTIGGENSATSVKCLNYTKKAAKNSLSGDKARDAINFARGEKSYWCQGGLFSIHNNTVNISVNDITEIDKDKLTEVQAENNILMFKPGIYYEMPNPDGTKAILTASNGIESPPVTDTVLHGDEYPKGYEAACCHTSGILHSLVGSASSIGLYFLYDKKDVVKTLTDAGIKPGKFTIGVEGYKSQTFYLDHSGLVYPYAENACRLAGVNNSNYAKYNLPEGTKYVIDGQEYQMDENKHFHIPDDVMISGNIKLEDADGRFINLKANDTWEYSNKENI